MIFITIFKIKDKFYIASESAPPPPLQEKILGAPPLGTFESAVIDCCLIHLCAYILMF
jgi:hypothetical protein